MTEFSALQLCWFGLGWVAGLPKFSHGTKWPLCLCWARKVGAAAQPGSLQPSGSVMTELWVGSPSWHCHYFYPSSVSIMPKRAFEVPALAVLVMGWAGSGELKGFCCTYFLFVQAQRGETQRKFSSQFCPVFHSSHAFEGIKSGSLVPVKPREIKYCSLLQSIF